MTPATARFYEAVVNGALIHFGDSRLARHVGKPYSARSPAGPGWPRNAKTPRRIDAAAATVMAHDRAAALAGVTRDSIYL
jgi:phage terminase large subunit-like protein